MRYRSPAKFAAPEPTGGRRLILMLMARRQMEVQQYELLLCGIPRCAGHVVLGRDYRGWRSRSLGDVASRSALWGMPDAALRISAFRYARCPEDGAARGRESSSERRIRRDAPQRPLLNPASPLATSAPARARQSRLSAAVS